MINFLSRIVKIIGVALISFFLIYMLSIPIIATIAKSNDLDYKFTYVYKICPVLIVNDLNVLTPQKYSLDVLAYSLGPIVILTENAWAHPDALTHELQHVKQNYKGLFFITMIRQFFSPKYMVFLEYEAYSTSSDPPDIEELTELLADIYNLGMTKKEIKETLIGYYD